MKRTRTLSLALMGAGAVTLTACDEPKTDVVLYQSVDQCARDGVSPDVCQQSYRDAVSAHLNAAPRYASDADCASDFGLDGCRAYSSSGGSSLFLPLMAGYMMGNTVGGSSRYKGQPLYRSRGDRQYRTAGNVPVGSVLGRAQVARSVAAPPLRRIGISQRGGFGASAARHTRSSGGGFSFGG